MIIHKSQEIQMLESSPGEGTVRFYHLQYMCCSTEALRQHALTQGWVERKIFVNRLSQTSLK